MGVFPTLHSLCDIWQKLEIYGNEFADLRIGVLKPTCNSHILTY